MEGEEAGCQLLTEGAEGGRSGGSYHVLINPQARIGELDHDPAPFFLRGASTGPIRFRSGCQAVSSTATQLFQIGYATLCEPLSYFAQGQTLSLHGFNGHKLEHVHLLVHPSVP